MWNNASFWDSVTCSGGVQQGRCLQNLNVAHKNNLLNNPFNLICSVFDGAEFQLNLIKMPNDP